MPTIAQTVQGTNITPALMGGGLSYYFNCIKGTDATIQTTLLGKSEICE